MARENFTRCLHVRRVHAARLSPTFPARFQRTPESNFLWLSRLCLLVASFPDYLVPSRGRWPSTSSSRFDLFVIETPARMDFIGSLGFWISSTPPPLPQGLLPPTPLGMKFPSEIIRTPPLPHLSSATKEILLIQLPCLVVR